MTRNDGLRADMASGDVADRALAVVAELLEVDDDDGLGARVGVACGGDSALEAEVWRILDEEDADDFMARPLVYIGVVDDMLGRVIGDGTYRLESVLGEGGMGVVYEAVRVRDYSARVAVKVLKVSSREQRDRFRRFERERDTLALLNHPFIARLFDGGEIEGLPFLAMELVEGRRLDRYCEEQNLSVRKRVELFLKACSAVGFAHRNGILHRDLKPSNILVTEQGSPKLLDFGIAKPVTEGMTATIGEGNPMTPAYASPEQLNGIPLTTATDVYSLGVILFQMLTGRLPYVVEGKALNEVVQLICERVPTRPSVVAGSLPERELSGLLRGDLDAIVMKALRKEPDRRYRTVDEMVADIQRHVDMKPVEARGDGFFYVAGRFCRRFKSAVIAALVVMMAVVITLVNTMIQAGRVRQERDIAREERDRAQRSVEFTVDMFKSADPDVARGKDPTIRDVLNSGVERIRRDITSDDVLRGKLLRAAGEVLVSVGEFEIGVDALKEALQLEKGNKKEIIFFIGEAFRRQFRYAEADEWLSKAVERSRDSDSWRSDAFCSLGEVRFVRGMRVDGERLIEEGLSGVNESVFCKELWGSVLESKRQFEAAMVVYEDLMKHYRRTVGINSSGYARSLAEVGEAMFYLGERVEGMEYMREGLRILEELYGQNNLYSAKILFTLARAVRFEGDMVEAEVILRTLLSDHGDLRRRHSVSGLARQDLAAILGMTGRYVEARFLQEEALRFYLDTVGRRHEYTASAHCGMGRIDLAAGSLEKARGWFESCLEIVLDVAPQGSADEAYPLSYLGLMDVEDGNVEGGERLLRRALDVRERFLDDQSLLVVRSRVELAEVLVRRGKVREGGELFRTALKAADKLDSKELVKRIEIGLRLVD